MEVVPSALAALGMREFDNTLGLRDCTGGCVLLIDGLGAELLDAHADAAPVITELRAGTLHVGFPSTTAAGLAALGTGVCSGQHGMVGYSFELPEVGVLNALRWRQHPWGEDLRSSVVPEEVQPMPTTFERAAAAGLGVRVISGAEFTGSGLTRAVLRGGRYVGVHALGDLAASVVAGLTEGAFCYGYHAQLDMLGHVYGPGSAAWRMQLHQVDRLVESIVDAMPAGTFLAVVADHGMVELDESVVDADAQGLLRAGVRAIGGEVRARHVYADDGAHADVLAAWRETLGERAWVVTREEAVEAGWFGASVPAAVLPRIGDVVAAARGRSGVLLRQVERLESELLGHHGSLSSAEQFVPLAVAYG
ncbi:MAG: alkaline phosphatase family protein [Actinophytocola sp.]|nr:alkaline phosphatase family protein [Actinophytocola sp.]